MTNFRELFKRVQKYPGMYLPEWKYTVLVAFIYGCDQATGGTLLKGFNDWVRQRVLKGRESAVGWSTIIASQYMPELLSGQLSEAELTPDLSDKAARDLFSMLDQFLSEQSGK